MYLSKRGFLFLREEQRNLFLNLNLKNLKICISVIFILFLFPGKIYGQSLADVQTYLTLGGHDINYAEFKFLVDQIVDPSIDVKAVKASLSKLTERIRVDLTDNATSRQKIAAIRKHIYVAGEWNDNRPFAYDLSDPLGHNIQNKLLSTYLETRRGNCVSMPILFLIVGPYCIRSFFPYKE